MKSHWPSFLLAAALCAATANAQDETLLPEDVEAAVTAFVGPGGFGSRHPDAPAAVDQFGRLAGVWAVEQELRKRDMSWLKETTGVWVWKYAVGGFGTQDFWYQNENRLPSYMTALGHDYVLTSLRVFDPSTAGWKVAWISNGGGGGAGAVFGQFEAKEENGDIVMRGAGAEEIGLQRIVFYDISDRLFRWRSEYSQDDGKTWIEIMRLTARRIR